MSDERKRLFRSWTDGYHALHRLSEVVEASGLEEPLLELVKIRASQVNGCAYCIDMHTKDARATGETEQRIYGLSAWREAPFFSPRERAALELTEAVTTLTASTGVPRPVVDAAAAHFAPEELTRLVYAIIEINAWNRLVITVGAPEAGSYRRSDPG
jgi:AhpD family alkylhydroperoxidase